PGYRVQTIRSGGETAAALLARLCCQQEGALGWERLARAPPRALRRPLSQASDTVVTAQRTVGAPGTASSAIHVGSRKETPATAEAALSRWTTSRSAGSRLPAAVNSRARQGHG